MPRYQTPAQVRYRVVADEAVILRLTEGKVVGLNWTGTRIFELLQDGASQAEVVDQLAREVEAEADQLAADVEAFVQELLEAGILEPAAG